MECHPPDGLNCGVVGTITPLIDIRIDDGRMPEAIADLLHKHRRVR